MHLRQHSNFYQFIYERAVHTFNKFELKTKLGFLLDNQQIGSKPKTLKK